jgi:hypothetical protein
MPTARTPAFSQLELPMFVDKQRIVFFGQEDRKRIQRCVAAMNAQPSREWSIDSVLGVALQIGLDDLERRYVIDKPEAIAS